MSVASAYAQVAAVPVGALDWARLRWLRLLGPLERRGEPMLPTSLLCPGEFQLGPLRVRCRLGDIAELIVLRQS